jgi:hypothetical protein
MNSTNTTIWEPILDSCFAPFSDTKITHSSLRDTQHEATESMRVKIRSNQIVFVEKSNMGAWVWRMRGYLKLLQDTLAIFKIPNVDFIISTPDHAISAHRPPLTDIPVFSFCKSDKEDCILFPFTRMGAADTGIDFSVRSGRADWHRIPTWHDELLMVNEINKKYLNWNNKKNRVFFGGHSYAWNNVRIKYFKLCLEYPHKLVGIITYTADGHVVDRSLDCLFGPAKPMSEYPSYKYLLHLDGNSGADRLRYLLGFNSVVLKQKSPIIEFFYPLLVENVHYLSINDDLSDLLAIIEELDKDPIRAQMIANEGTIFANEVLNYKNVLFYIKLALERYASLQQ